MAESAEKEFEKILSSLLKSSPNFTLLNFSKICQGIL